MGHAIIAEREVKARGFLLKQTINPRVKKYRNNLKSSGVEFNEIYLPAGVDPPDAMRRRVPDFSTRNFHVLQPLYVFTWADGQL